VVKSFEVDFKGLTIKLFIEGEDRTTFSAGSFELMDFCLISIPIGHCDELEILLYENPSICPKGVDVTQTAQRAPLW
tara:strand:+ start:810 stop:1040 length:231 start_codon:yes stop_codon:yes gene_type:complete